MPTAQQTRQATSRVSDAAVAESRELVGAMLRGSPDAGRSVAFSTIPAVVAYYGAGVASLAVDAYEERRELVGLRDAFEARPVLTSDEEKLFNAIAWATDPLYEEDRLRAAVAAEMDARFRDVVSGEVMGYSRRTTTANMTRDPRARGWRRIARADACGFCHMLAGRGAVYIKATVNFSAHDNCHCTPECVFDGESWTEADDIQVIAAKPSSNRSRFERQLLRDYLKRQQ